MSIRNSHLAGLLYQFSENRLLPFLGRYFKSPNHLTSLGAGLAVFVPVGFWLHPLLGWAFLTVSAGLDVLDGQFARMTDQASDFGAFWDSSLDRISDFFYLMGFWTLFRQFPNFEFASFMISYGLTATLLISYVKARAESLGKTCRSGLMERGIRTIFLIVWAFLLGILPEMRETLLWFGLGLFCSLTTLTIIQRLREIRSQFFVP